MIVAQNATAQEQATRTEAATEPQTAPRVEEIVVTGSRIAGTKITEALPVTVVGQDEIAATAAVSGDELLRSIPQLSDQSFNSSNGQTSSNFARGGVGSIDMPGLGVGNTIIFLNRRRILQHTSQQASQTHA